VLQFTCIIAWENWWTGAYGIAAAPNAAIAVWKKPITQWIRVAARMNSNR
jgi:hypothetical protein